MRNSATNFENWRCKISYQTRNFRNGTRKISGNIDLGCAICKLSSLDDLLKSTETTEKAIRLVHQLRELLQRGGFRLTK